MITQYTIYGERCSGTNYLENLININFDVKITWKYGWKHFVGFSNLRDANNDNTLFIGIVRNPYDFINSLYREQHHLPKKFKIIDNYLNDEFYSLDKTGNEIMEDRNMHTKERYKNIFDMRNTKLNFLINDMPLLVKNYILIRHEDLLDDFDNTMNKIKEKGLRIKNNIDFPLNFLTYKTSNHNKLFVRNSKINHISKKIIKKRVKMIYENKLNYKKYLMT